MSLHEGMGIRVLDAPGCYECVARVERKSALQVSGLVRTVELIAKLHSCIPNVADSLGNFFHLSLGTSESVEYMSCTFNF